MSGMDESNFVNTPAEHAAMDQRFAETLDQLRAAFNNPQGSFAVYISNPDEMIEHVTIGKVHPMEGVVFWAMLISKVMVGADKWVELAAKEMHRRYGEDT